MVCAGGPSCVVVAPRTQLPVLAGRQSSGSEERTAGTIWCPGHALVWIVLGGELGGLGGSDALRQDQGGAGVRAAGQGGVDRGLQARDVTLQVVRHRRLRQLGRARDERGELADVA